MKAVMSVLHVACSDRTRHFSNWCDTYKVVKVVHGNRSDNHCNQPDKSMSILLQDLKNILTGQTK